MAWTTPKTDWVLGELATQSHLNDIGNNLAALKDPPSDNYELDEGSDYSTSSTTFVDVDGTNLALTINTNGGDVLVHFHGMIGKAAASHYWYFDVEVDGTRIGGDDGIIGQLESTNSRDPVSFTRLITGLAAGSHTFKLQWKVNANSITLYAGAGTTNSDLHPQFWAREIS